MLRAHARYDFSPITARKDWSWPGGARLAFYVAINVEQFPFGEGLGPELNPRLPEPDIPNHSWREWGNRVGVWRLIELLDEFAVPSSVLLNTAIYDHCPEVAEAFRARGDEFVGHGYTNAERQGDMTENAERALIRGVRDTIAAREGAAPEGWMGPWISETHATPDLLAEEGYAYTLDWASDDQPIWLRVRSGGRLLSIPYARPTNDLPMMHGARLPPSVWADIMIDQIDELLDQSRRQPLVWNLSLHPYLMHAFRLKHLRRVLRHARAAGSRIWMARAGDIAAYARALPEGTIT